MPRIYRIVLLVGALILAGCAPVGEQDSPQRQAARRAVLKAIRPTTTQQTSNAIFLQLELNGLARVGTSPLELLRRSVPGYIPANDPSLRNRDRSLDPLPEF